jgi:hypothetical protein
MSLSSVHDRVRRDLERHPSPTRRRLRARRAATIALSLLPLPATVLIRGVCVGERPLAYAIALVGCAVVASSMSAWILFGGRAGGLWSPRARLFTLAVAAPLGLALGQACAMILWRSALSPSAPVESVRCFVSSLVCGALALTGLAFAFRRSDPIAPAATGAALGAMVSCLVDVAQMLQCPFGDAHHLLTGHLAPVVVLGGLGSLLARRLLAIRWIGLGPRPPSGTVEPRR